MTNPVLAARNVTIRPACAQDAEAIATLWRPWVLETAITFAPQPKTAAEVREMIATRAAEGHCFLIAFDDEEGLLGFATYGQFRAGLGYRHAMEHTIILSPKCRQSGLGRALMREIEKDARAKGHHIMVAGVSGENADGIAFHQKIGYVEQGLIRGAGFKFDRRMDLHLLVKELATP